jgi:hypothetical protein
MERVQLPSTADRPYQPPYPKDLLCVAPSVSAQTLRSELVRMEVPSVRTVSYQSHPTPPSRPEVEGPPLPRPYYVLSTRRASVRTVAATVARSGWWRCTRCVRERDWMVSDSYQLVVQQSVPPTPPRAMPTPARRGAVHAHDDKRIVAKSGVCLPRPTTSPAYSV